jgi:hypothetical protein
VDRGEGVEFDSVLDEATALIARSKADRAGKAD